MKYLIPAIVLYLGGQIWFSMTALFNTEWDGNTAWEKFYFLWQDTSGAGWLVWFLVYKLVSESTYRKTVLPILIYSIFIFIWDLVSYITNFGADHPVMTGAFFGAGALTVLYFMIVDVIRRWKS